MEIVDAIEGDNCPLTDDIAPEYICVVDEKEGLKGEGRGEMVYNVEA